MARRRAKGGPQSQRGKRQRVNTTRVACRLFKPYMTTEGPGIPPRIFIRCENCSWSFALPEGSETNLGHALTRAVLEQLRVEDIPGHQSA